MGRKRGTGMDDAVIVLGLAVVGYLAYREYFPGQPVVQVLRDLESQIAGFIKQGIAELGSLVPPLPAMLPPATAAAPAPISVPAIPEVPMTPAAITKAPATNTQVPDIEPRVMEPARKPAGSGQVARNPTTPSASQGRGSEGGYTVVAAAGDFDNKSSTSATMNLMEKHNIQFIIGLGDYSYTSESISSWFSSVIGPRFQGRMKAARGNHDSSGGASTFNQNGWSFVHKVSPNLAVVFIDTESGVSANTLDTQTAQAKGMATNVAYAFHKPYVTSRDAHHKGSENKSGSVIEAAARKHGVKLILAGHNHNYEHSIANGIHYVTSGAAGRKFYETGCDIPGAVKCVDNVNGFLKINIGARLACQFVGTNGQTIDTFTV